MESSQDLDPATTAFARLENEVGVVRRLLAANDPSETLGEIAARLAAVSKSMQMLAERPAMQLTPDGMADAVVAAGDKARKADGAAIAQARDRIDAAARQFERLIGTAATIRQQRERLAWAVGGGLLLGVLLWSIVPGIVVRAAPASWRWPERMAAHVLRLDRWRAGERLLATADPDRWQAVVRANGIIHDNHRAIAACLEKASTRDKPVRCAISISQGTVAPD